MGITDESAEVRALLLEREVRGLRVPLIARLSLLGFALAVVTGELLLVREPEPEPGLTALVLATLAAVLGANIYLLRPLQRAERVQTVGLAGALFDAGFVITLSGLAQLAGAQDGLAVGYVFATELPITVLTIVVVNGLALQPRYPLIVGTGALVAMLVPLVRMASDPLTQLSSDRVAVYARGATDPSQIITTVVMVTGGALATAYAARAARRTVLKGVAQEIEHARFSEEAMAQLFDVSLASKGARVGAGLGLASAQGIVQRHRGELSVRSQPGQGALFVIRLARDAGA